MFKVGNQ